MSTGPRKGSDRAGYTLFELLIVLILLSVFGSLFFSRIGDFVSDGDLRAASRMVINETRRYRAMAAYSREDQFLAFDMERNTMYGVDARGVPVTEGRSSEGVALAREKPLPIGVRLEDVVVHPIGKVHEGVARVRFRADGSVERSLIHLRNTGDKAYTLQMNPLTGTVRVYETYVDEKTT